MRRDDRERRWRTDGGVADVCVEPAQRETLGGSSESDETRTNAANPLDGRLKARTIRFRPRRVEGGEGGRVDFSIREEPHSRNVQLDSGSAKNSVVSLTITRDVNRDFHKSWKFKAWPSVAPGPIGKF